MSAVRDIRTTPFVWQSVAALEALRTLPAKRGLRATAIAVYVAMTELANEQRDGSFSATRAQIGEYAGISKRTVDSYTDHLEALGLVRVERRRDADALVNLPNVYVLLDAPLAQPTALPPCIEQHHPGAANSTPIQEEPQEEQQEEGRTDVAEVWAYWLERRRPSRTTLSPGAEKQIARALNAGFSVDDLKRAIDGLLASDWHRTNGKLQLSTIFTTGPGTQTFDDRVQSFIDKAPGSPRQPQRALRPAQASLLSWARQHGEWSNEEKRWRWPERQQELDELDRELADKGLRVIWHALDAYAIEEIA